jgi:hypothetical protein
MYRQREDDDEPSEERMNKHTKRRKRRRANAIVRVGKKAVRRHARKGGRTGHIQTRRTPAKRVQHTSSRPNPPGPHNMDLGI